MSNLKNQNVISNSKTDVKYRSYCFGVSIIGFLQKLPDIRIYWSISDQLMRSATSIGANIIEGKSSSSKREFIKYFEIALKSANETKFWLCLLRDSKLSNPLLIAPLLKEAVEISNMLGSSILTLKGK